MKNTLALLALATLAGTASAQLNGKLTNPLRVQIGVSFPGDSDIRDNIARAGLYVGASYDLYQTGVNARGQYIRAGGFVDATFLNGGGIRNNNFAFGAQGRFYVANTESVGFYLGAGVGAYFFTFRGGGASTDTTRFGGKLFLGGEFAQRYFAELGVNFIGDVLGTKGDFYTASVGVKF